MVLPAPDGPTAQAGTLRRLAARAAPENREIFQEKQGGAIGSTPPMPMPADPK